MNEHEKIHEKINNFLIRFLRSKKFTFLLILGLGLYVLNYADQKGQLKDFTKDTQRFINNNNPFTEPVSSQVFFEKKDEINVKVLRVLDGDTIETEYAINSYLPSNQRSEKLKIRLFGIDAPEKKQEFGKEAKDYLSSLILGKEVKLIIENIDRYKRIVGTIYLQENEKSTMSSEKDINRNLVKNGYAWAYREYSTKYLAEEADAKMFKLGLWKNPQAINPADFRKRKREK